MSYVFSSITIRRSLHPSRASALRASPAGVRAVFTKYLLLLSSSSGRLAGVRMERARAEHSGERPPAAARGAGVRAVVRMRALVRVAPTFPPIDPTFYWLAVLMLPASNLLLQVPRRGDAADPGRRAGRAVSGAVMALAGMCDMGPGSGTYRFGGVARWRLVAQGGGGPE